MSYTKKLMGLFVLLCCFEIMCSDKKRIRAGRIVRPGEAAALQRENEELRNNLRELARQIRVINQALQDGVVQRSQLSTDLQALVDLQTDSSAD